MINCEQLSNLSTPEERKRCFTCNKSRLYNFQYICYKCERLAKEEYARQAKIKERKEFGYCLTCKQKETAKGSGYCHDHGLRLRRAERVFGHKILFKKLLAEAEQITREMNLYKYHTKKPHA